MLYWLFGTVAWMIIAFTPAALAADTIDLAKVTVVTRGDKAPVAEHSAAVVLVEEVAKRTGVKWTAATKWPSDGAVIVVTSGGRKVGGKAVPKELITSKAEGFAIATDSARNHSAPTIWIVGADGRGALYGVGYLLRHLNWNPSRAPRLDGPLNEKSAPAYAIRGHQLGYRPRANSWDAWEVQQFDQYIRELALFGANSIENIPFEDSDPGVLMKMPRKEMNRAMSKTCARYDLDYWAWTPAVFDLKDKEKRAAHIVEHEAFYRDCSRLDGIFFPGDNPADLVCPFLEDLSVRLAKYHPKAKIWLSLQSFDKASVDFFYKWLDEKKPKWFGGVVAGPSSPPIPETRVRLPKQYGLRHYPDITHTVRCQYPNYWWDRAFAFTLGRECANPQPIFYARVHNLFAPYTNGFLSYSDGVHDDLNKNVWTMLSWNPQTDLRDIVLQYSRFFFGSDVAADAASGIFALEKNWDGALITNGGVNATLAWWQALEKKAPALRDNWRWQLCLLRAYYDEYVRARLIAETQLEQEANEALAGSPADAAMDNALAILKRVDTECPRPELRARIFELCDDLFKSIGLQTSVEKYHAAGEERGAVLDYVDYPVNNRRWIEDEIAKARKMASEPEKRAHLDLVRNWEDPGPGGYYDDLGNVAKAEHVVRGEIANTDPDCEHSPNADFMWWEEGRTRARQSWISYAGSWPTLRYEGLDPEASYVLKTTGYGDCFLRVDGQRLEPLQYDKEIGGIKEFPIPRELCRDRIISVTFDKPDEAGLNWRLQSRLCEVWLIKK